MVDFLPSQLATYRATARKSKKERERGEEEKARCLFYRDTSVTGCVCSELSKRERMHMFSGFKKEVSAEMFLKQIFCDIEFISQHARAVS